jgi:broad specificity phosphatase PhoE
MLAHSTRFLAAFALACGLIATLPAMATASILDDKGLVNSLRAGVVRHGATFPDQADTDPLNFDNIAAQRNLNDKGKALAKAFGDALRQVGIPVGHVYTSKYNRAYGTATLAGFKNIEKTADLTEGGLVVSPNENSRRAEAFRTLIATAPQPRTNTILITHKPNIIDALGKDWFDVKEGEASIFRPQNGHYTLSDRVQMTDWSRIVSGEIDLNTRGSARRFAQPHQTSAWNLSKIEHSRQPSMRSRIARSAATPSNEAAIHDPLSSTGASES